MNKNKIKLRLIKKILGADNYTIKTYKGYYPNDIFIFNKQKELIIHIDYDYVWVRRDIHDPILRLFSFKDRVKIFNILFKNKIISSVHSDKIAHLEEKENELKQLNNQ